MKLKYLLLPLIINSSIGMAYAENALKSDGTVEINGKVVSQTCTVKAGDELVTVTLPTVGTNSLKEPGSVDGATLFHINLANCSAPGNGNEYGGNDNGKETPSSLSMVGIYFSGINIDNNGTLTNVAASNAAGNVNVQLLNKDRTAIDLTKMSGVQVTNSQNLSEAKNGTLVFDFFAQYYATSQSTPGDVQATVPFVIVYK